MNGSTAKDFANSMIPVLISDHALRNKPTTVELYQLDSSPACGRQPLLLIHGLNGERSKLFRWKDMTRYLSHSPEFQRNYKIYLARYNSKTSLATLQEEFKPLIKKLSYENNRAGVVVLTISIGGNIVRQSMNEAEVDEAVSQVITLGTPYHGSPLFNEDWMLYSMMKRHRSPLTKTLRYFGYKLYFAQHKNLLADYQWDNADGRMPIGTCRYLFPVPHTVKLKTDGKPTSTPPAENTNAAKWIAYAGYLPNENYSKHGHLRSIMHWLNSPFYFANVTFPAYLGREHSMLQLLSDEIANVPTTGVIKENRYRLNDGISPIFSSLNLTTGNNCDNDSSALVTEGGSVCSSSIRTHLGHMKGRLFMNLDHISFLKGDGQRAIADQLKPWEAPRPLFSWLLKDLLSTRTERLTERTETEGDEAKVNGVFASARSSTQKD